MYTLPIEERDRRWKQVRNTMEKRRLDCLIVWGTYGFKRNLAANLRYLSNVILTEGYLVFPVAGEPTLITFSGSLDTSWIADGRRGHPLYSKVISDRLRELRLENASIGIVGLSGFIGELGFPHSVYVALVGNFPDASFSDATDIIELSRIIKSEAEIRCFEQGCEVGDKVMQVIVDTAGAGITDGEVIARVLDTMYRGGCDIGSMILYCSGKEVVHPGQGQRIPLPGPRQLEPGDMILTEFDPRYLGYQAQFNQPFSVGEPDKEWSKMFSVASEAFNSGFKALKPGITAGELDKTMLPVILEAGYTYRNPAFHGLGLGLEAPMGSFPVQTTYKPDASFKIGAGMVLELEPHVVTPDGKRGLTLGCPVAVTETGCRLLSNTWEPEFKIV